MEQIVQIFKALGNEIRLKILIILSERKTCAKGISKQLNISEAAVSQHIRILKEAGIIVGVKAGYYVYYDIQECVLQELVKYIEQINEDYSMIRYRQSISILDKSRSVCKTDKDRSCPQNNTWE